MDIMPTEQGKEYDTLVELYMKVISEYTSLKHVSGMYTLMENYCAKYNTPFNELVRDIHLAAIMTIALQDKK